MSGVRREIWTGELVKSLREKMQGDFLEGIPDQSSIAENDVIHLVDVGVDPDVLVNNTSYPIAVQELADGDIAISLDKFQTKATPVTDDELFAISYDRMKRVKDAHANAIHDAKVTKAAHAFSPQTHKADTPVLLTTGEYVDGQRGRRRFRREDIVAMKAAFDALGVPVKGRRLVLCTDHVNDLLLMDQKFADQYYNYKSGRISNLYGFDIYEYGNCPLYATNGTKKAIGTSPETGEFQASFAFVVENTFKATGSTKMYYSEAKTDPQHQRSLLNYRHYFIALPKKQRAIGAIRSDYKS